MVNGASTIREGLSEEDQARFAAIKEKADRLGVRDINFCGTKTVDSLECYERTLEIIEKNKARYDRNAGES